MKDTSKGDTAEIFERIAFSGRPVNRKIHPHEAYEEEMESRRKKLKTLKYKYRCEVII